MPKKDRGFYAVSALTDVLYSNITANLLDQVNAIKASWEEQKLFVIGIQIRVGGEGDAGFLNNLANAFKCATYLAEVSNTESL